MEKVMSFLGDNYIWFFIGAGILCFALIGFIIDSKKKDKKVSNNETIQSVTGEESIEVTGGPVVDLGIQNNEVGNLEINDIPISENKPLETMTEPIINTTNVVENNNDITNGNVIDMNIPDVQPFEMSTMKMDTPDLQLTEIPKTTDSNILNTISAEGPVISEVKIEQPFDVKANEPITTENVNNSVQEQKIETNIFDEL